MGLSHPVGTIVRVFALRQPRPATVLSPRVGQVEGGAVGPITADEIGPSLGQLALSSAGEEFNRAYVYGVLAAARCTWSVEDVDVDGLDVKVTHQYRRDDEYRHTYLGLQLKHTRQTSALHDSYISQRLLRDHFNKLRETQPDFPRLLVVMVVPPTLDDWLRQSEDCLMVRRCAYYVSLKNRRALAAAQQSTTVQLPRKNVFNVEAVCSLMDQARRRNL